MVHIQVSSSNLAHYELNLDQWQRQRICTKDSNEAVDLPGTLCGIQLINTIDGPACDGYNPGLWECPSGYTPRQWESEKNVISLVRICAKTMSAALGVLRIRNIETKD
ncbi:unnamed protein product [Didymodactylos carnosus]|uniref:Uncharacterized protein n=1 Tax=Didymodactylos carnosus TaxID=1234261 RepID=A0A813YMK4_9BILA|nr:unnamed protein product [Didymodactylos carnosus]CAF3671885.1 unnamed protein product [Didymodactylos carnosus]